MRDSWSPRALISSTWGENRAGLEPTRFRWPKSCDELSRLSKRWRPSCRFRSRSIRPRRKSLRLALDAGATIINDISALSADPEMALTVARAGAGVVLMHMQGNPRTMQLDPQYKDLIGEIHHFLECRVRWAETQGIPRERIAVDPGIGFGKTHAHNLAILQNVECFDNLGCAVLIGTSRKGFLGKITARPLAERATASVVSSLAGCVRGARVVRVHDVAPMVDAIRVWTAVQGWENPR